MYKSFSVRGLRIHCSTTGRTMPRWVALLLCAGLCTSLAATGFGCEDRAGRDSEPQESTAENAQPNQPSAPPTEAETQKRFEALVEEFHPQFFTEEPNAWPEFAALLSDFQAKYKPQASTDTEPLKDFSNITSTSDKVTKAEFDAAMKLLEGVRADGFFDRTHALVGKRRFVRQAPKRPFVKELLPELGQVRNLARAQNARMLLAFSKKDYEEAAKAYEELLVMSKAVAYQPILLSRLVSIAVAALATRSLRDELNHREVPTAFLERIKVATLDWQGSYPGIELTLRGEELQVLDTLAYFTGPDGKGGKVDPQRADVVKDIPTLATLQSVGSYAELSKISAEFFARVKDYSKQPRLVRLNMQDPLEVLKDFHDQSLIVALLAPATERTLQANESLHVETAGLLVHLAIEEFRAKEGKLPATLENLVPKYLTTLPRDPLAIVDLNKPKDGGLIYKVTAENTRRGFILYSVGADGTDNAGKVAAEPHLTLRDKGDGTDFVFTNPEKARPAFERRDSLK